MKPTTKLILDAVELLKTLEFNYIGNRPETDFDKKIKQDVQNSIKELLSLIEV